jgi:phosphotransferase system enzyme I (PtsP)
MVLSELIAGAGLVDKRVAASAVRDQAQARITGLKLVTGMARGCAVYHQPRVLIEHTVAEDTEAERHRVYSAFRKMREQIDTMTSLAEFGTAGEHQEILETYKMFAYDEGWSRRINEAIDSGLTAEAAIERVQQRTRMRMREIDDPLLQERMHDLDDLANRLLRIVSGQLGTAAQMGLPHDAILIARNLGPAELLEYDRRKLKGVILEEGSLTAHVTIVARAMGVPMLGRIKNVRQLIGEGDTVLLDVNDSVAWARPTNPIEDAFAAKLLVTQKRRAQFAALRDQPPVTKDGKRITVMVNAGLRDDVAALNVVGADGIGLFRTEFQFLVSATLPRRESQQRLYRSVLEAAGEKPVVFRTVDIGGDKALPYLHVEEATEENPAMGWRALRLSLERDALMKAQARALLEAAAGARAQHHVPDDLRAVGVRRGQGAGRKPARLADRAAQAASQPDPLWRHAGGAGAGRGARHPAAQDRLPVDRHQRPHAIPLRGRPRQPAPRRALRLAVPRHIALPAPDRSCGGRA